MDFRHLIVTCLFSKLRLPFDNQKVKENYAIFCIITSLSLIWNFRCNRTVITLIQNPIKNTGPILISNK